MEVNTTGIRCDVVNCGISSTNFLACLGGCGKWIHSICGGISRSTLNSDASNSNRVRYICVSCELHFSDGLSNQVEIKNLLVKYSDDVGYITSQLKQLQQRVNNSEDYIEDIDKSLQMLDGSGFSKRLENIERSLKLLGNYDIAGRLRNIEDSLESLKLKPSCLCGELVDSVTKLISQVERNVSQTFNTNTEKIVHSLHQKMLSSTSDFINCVSTNISVKIDDKIDELALSTSACASSTLTHTSNTESPEPASPQRLVPDDDLNTMTPLLSEISFVEPLFSQPGMKYPNVQTDKLLALNVAKNMAGLCCDFGWEGGVLYEEYARPVMYFSVPEQTVIPEINKKKMKKKNRVKWNKPVVISTHKAPVFPLVQTKRNVSRMNQDFPNRDLRHRTRTTRPQHRSTPSHCSSSVTPLMGISIRPIVCQSVPPIRWKYEEELHSRFLSVLDKRN